jgi:hypothetical protein
MAEKIWKLSCKCGWSPLVTETIYTTEDAFNKALHDDAYVYARDLSATLPDGRVLTEAELRRRYPTN